MRRRDLVILLGVPAAQAIIWPFTGRAQQSTGVARIGYLATNSASISDSYLEAFRAGLREIGYVEGKNFVIESRFAEYNTDRLPGLAAELVRLNVDVIVTYGPGVLAAQGATPTIPIVMASYADAVAAGVIASLAHQGGNITGSTFLNPELMAKRVELLKEVVPSMTQVAVLLKPGHAVNGPILNAMETTAKALKLGLHPFEANEPSEFESTFAAMAEKQIGAVVIQDHPIFIGNAEVLVALAVEHRLPSIGFLEWAGAGGLMAYGVSFHDLFRRAAYFVDKILKGAKPGDMPVEQPTRFRFVINLKTVKALGLAIPDSLLARTDETIE
jgi:putative tryptophan/tyrosine transport system substrate-binding protein